MKCRLICVLLLAPLAGAQSQASGSDSKQPGPTFTATTQLVMVPVVVTKGGTHVGGLQRDAFTVLEDGKPQRLAGFEEVTAAALGAWPKLEPGVYTNAIALGAQSTRVTLFLLDLLNTPFV